MRPGTRGSTEGIASARRTGNRHALSEMEALLMDLE